MTGVAPIDRSRLTEVALAILLADLEAWGNVLSNDHKAALRSMLDTWAAYLTGEVTGRKAFALPTGMGKTAAVVAFITAVHRCGYFIPMSVAASQVQALCKVHQSLTAHGVPNNSIGIKHSVPDAVVASTGNDEYLIQLVTHARVRGGTDVALFSEYQGQPRALCLYDETLWRADTASLRVIDALAAVGWLARRGPPGPLAEHLKVCDRSISGAVAAAESGTVGVPLDLPTVDEGELQSWLDWLDNSGAPDKGVADDVRQLLRLCGESLQVLPTDQGTGIIAIRQAIPDALANVAILDASANIRALAKLDDSIAVLDTLDAAALKSFESVEVFQYASGGGRDTLSKQAKAARGEASALSREVADIIRNELADSRDRCILVFTYMRRSHTDDPQARLKKDLRALGIAVDAMTSPDAGGKQRPRFEFLTWGQHEGLNGYEHCKTVILAGVLQRGHLSLAANIKGQLGDPSAETPGHLVRHYLESEVAHAVYQAASRGSCRRVNNGRAQPMRLHIVHKYLGLKAALDPVMPGAVWSYPTPAYLPKAHATGKRDELLETLLVYLKGLPAATQKLSTVKLKAALGLAGDETSKQTWTAVVKKSLLPSVHGWAFQGRSLVRGI